ncbi:J domain-containing protein [Nitrosomonas sp. Nm34]|uniref:J domain-containing protein n=1 Tax=Nitrosomonas sp. Nm34 TaxID=1881055 RepID=UPI0008E796A2|nr:J domain-containing protein [Nitrosomonas sp. Nm34]SFI91422.1 hypothetical protein SAMN05428978_10574 [Nitrosomonas sp. Nm34]
MSHQFDLFNNETPATSEQTANNSATALKLTTQDSQLTPSQQRFNRLLERIEKLKKQLLELQVISDAHRPLYHQAIVPLRERERLLTREMVLWLDERLQRKGLTPTQKRIATTILCGLSEQLAAQGDEEMQILHDKHSTESLEQKEQASIKEMRTMMEDMLGESLTDEDSLETMQDVFNAGMARLREAEAEEKAHRQARVRKKKPTAAQLKAEAEQEEAETTLRKVFRQLASALHPDRENDPDERARKTALMSEANAAYDRRDLIALLQIQLRTELTDPASIAKMAEEKIASLTRLLKEQAQELEAELYHRRHAARHEFGLSSYETPSSTSLRRSLRREETLLKADIDAMQQDLQLIQDDKFFKRWLKDQTQPSNTVLLDEWIINTFR